MDRSSVRGTGTCNQRETPRRNSSFVRHDSSGQRPASGAANETIFMAQQIPAADSPTSGISDRVVAVFADLEHCVDEDPVSEQIVQLLINSQRPLYAYILTLVPDLEAADDVLQETNLLLWRKGREFVAGTNFFAWACRTAEFQALAWLRDRKRNRVSFNEALIRELASQSRTQIVEQVERARSLTGCIRRLSDRDQDLLQRRYTQGMSVTKLAREMGKTVNAVSRSLYRIRGLLLDCINRSVAT